MAGWNRRDRLVATSLVLAAGAALAQGAVVIRVELNGTPVVPDYAPGDPIALTLADSVDLVNIFAYDDVANQVVAAGSIGPVTFTDGGSPGDSDLKVFIGDGAFPALASANLPFVAANLDGLAIPESLRANTALAGAIAGNVAGPIACGSIFRLQVGGNVNASITAEAGAGMLAINQLVVGNSVSAGATVDVPQGNVTRIRTGSLVATGGIAGSVLVRAGEVEFIECVGAISQGSGERGRGTEVPFSCH